MPYIGASRRDIKMALRTEGRISFSRGGFVIHGAGAVKLSIRLASQLIERWWQSPEGTKLVIGYVHIKGWGQPYETITKSQIPVHCPKHIKLIEIVRPSWFAYPPQMNSTNPPMIRSRTISKNLWKRSVFQRLVNEKMTMENEAAGPYVNILSRHKDDLFTDPSAWPHYFAVWPAGILYNRNAQAINKVQKAWQHLENTRHVHFNMANPNKHPFTGIQYSNRWVDPALFNAVDPALFNAHFNANTLKQIKQKIRNARLHGARKAFDTTGLGRRALHKMYKPGGVMAIMTKKRFQANQQRSR